MPVEQWPFCCSQPLYPGACDDFMEKKQRLAADNISFAFSCELPALCEHIIDKCWRGEEGRGYPFSLLALNARGSSTVTAHPQAKEGGKTAFKLLTILVHVTAE